MGLCLSLLCPSVLTLNLFFLLPCSGLFIISPTGVLRQITVNDLPVGRSVDETLRLIRAFQFTDEHGGEYGKSIAFPC